MRFMVQLTFVMLTAQVHAGDAPSPLDRLDPKQNLPSQLPPGTPRAAVAMVQEQFRAIAGLSFSAQDKLLAASSWDNTVVLWKVEKDKLVLWDSLKASPSGIALSPVGKLLLAGTADSRVALWNLQGAKPKLQTHLAGHKQRPFQLAFSPTGKMLASACFDPVLRLWKMDNNEAEAWAFLANEKAPAIGVSSLSFSSDGKLLAAGNYLGRQTLRVWVTSGDFLDELELPAANAKLVAFAPQAPLLAFSGNDGTIHLWEFKDTKIAAKRTLPGHLLKDLDAGIKALAISPDGKLLVSGAADRKVILWNAATGKAIRDWLLPEEPRAFAFAADGRHFAVGADDGAIYVLRLEK